MAIAALVSLSPASASAAGDPWALADQVRADIRAAITRGAAQDLGDRVGDDLPDVKTWAARVAKGNPSEIEIAVVPRALSGDGFVARVVLSALVAGELDAKTLPAAFVRSDPKVGWRLQAGLPAGATTMALPADRRRAERWQRDLDRLRNLFPQRHKDAFHTLPRRDFEAALTSLAARVPRSTDAHITVTLIELIARVGDVHTGLGHPFDRLRLRIAAVKEGLVIVRAPADRRDLIGARVTHVGDRPVEQVLPLLGRLVAKESRWSLRTDAPGWLSLPEVLSALGITRTPRSLELDVVLASGKVARARLTLPAIGAPRPEPTAWPASLRRKHADVPYWFEAIEDGRAIYLKYDRCEDKERFRKLVTDLFPVLDRAELLIVDVRDNDGGNSDVVLPLWRALEARKGKPLAIVGLIGRDTRSSGLWAGVDLRYRMKAKLVGEPTGDRPNWYGEGRAFLLAEHGLWVRHSVKRHHVIKSEDPEALIPDVTIEESGRELVAGQDPALAAAVALGLTPPTTAAGR